MIRKGWEEEGERITEEREQEVRERLCMARFIDLASIPQQPCDPGVMPPIVTPVGSRASARVRRSRAEGGGGRWQEVERGRGKREKEKESWSRDGEGETDGTVVSVGLCTRTAKLVPPSPCTFMSPPNVPLCPTVSLDAKSLAQPDHLCRLYT